MRLIFSTLPIFKKVDLANWNVLGKIIKRMEGVMDLIVNIKRAIVLVIM